MHITYAQTEFWRFLSARYIQMCLLFTAQNSQNQKIADAAQISCVSTDITYIVLWLIIQIDREFNLGALILIIIIIKATFKYRYYISYYTHASIHPDIASTCDMRIHYTCMWPIRLTYVLVFTELCNTLRR